VVPFEGVTGYDPLTTRHREQETPLMRSAWTLKTTARPSASLVQHFHFAVTQE
jgi:hypothetical protein